MKTSQLYDVSRHEQALKEKETQLGEARKLRKRADDSLQVLINRITFLNQEELKLDKDIESARRRAAELLARQGQKDSDIAKTAKDVLASIPSQTTNRPVTGRSTLLASVESRTSISDSLQNSSRSSTSLRQGSLSLKGSLTADPPPRPGSSLGWRNSFSGAPVSRPGSAAGTPRKFSSVSPPYNRSQIDHPTDSTRSTPGKPPKPSATPPKGATSPSSSPLPSSLSGADPRALEMCIAALGGDGAAAASPRALSSRSSSRSRAESNSRPGPHPNADPSKHPSTARPPKPISRGGAAPRREELRSTAASPSKSPSPCSGVGSPSEVVLCSPSPPATTTGGEAYGAILTVDPHPQAAASESDRDLDSAWVADQIQKSSLAAAATGGLHSHQPQVQPQPQSSDQSSEGNTKNLLAIAQQPILSSRKKGLSLQAQGPLVEEGIERLGDLSPSLPPPVAQKLPSGSGGSSRAQLETSTIQRLQSNASPGGKGKGKGDVAVATAVAAVFAEDEIFEEGLDRRRVLPGGGNDASARPSMHRLTSVPTPAPVALTGSLKDSRESRGQDVNVMTMIPGGMHAGAFDGGGGSSFAGRSSPTAGSNISILSGGGGGAVLYSIGSAGGSAGVVSKMEGIQEFVTEAPKSTVKVVRTAVTQRKQSSDAASPSYHSSVAGGNSVVAGGSGWGAGRAVGAISMAPVESRQLQAEIRKKQQLWKVRKEFGLEAAPSGDSSATIVESGAGAWGRPSTDTP